MVNISAIENQFIQFIVTLFFKACREDFLSRARNMQKGIPSKFLKFFS